MCQGRQVPKCINNVGHFCEGKNVWAFLIFYVCVNVGSFVNASSQASLSDVGKFVTKEFLNTSVNTGMFGIFVYV